MKYKILPIAILLCLSATQIVSGQWQVTTGPSQPNVLSVATSGSNTFAAAGAAVSLTVNNGTNWSIASNGLTGSVYSVVTKGSDVFVGASAGAVFQSSNNGTNWTNTSTGLPAYDVKSLTVDGANIYAATFGIYKSANNGLFWSKLNQTWNATVSSIAVSGSTILAGTTNVGIYRSNDNGSTWNTINTGLPTQINAVTIIGSTYLAGSSSGLYISTNSGTNWTLTSVTDAIGSFTTVGNNVFAGGSNGGGVFLSTNSGTSWGAINNGLSNLTVYSLATNGTYVFTGTTGYVFRRLLTEVLPVSNNITTTSAPANGGNTTGGGNYPSGNTVTVSASANSGFIFNNWTENGNIVSANSTYIFTATADTSLVANFSATTAIQDEVTEDLMSIYPNPASNQLFIETIGRELSEVNIYNTRGTLVSQTKQLQNNSIDISQLPRGVYVAEIKTKDAPVKRRWVKM